MIWNILEGLDHLGLALVLYLKDVGDIITVVACIINVGSDDIILGGIS
jgi:hypothetical protein